MKKKKKGEKSLEECILRSTGFDILNNINELNYEEKYLKIILFKNVKTLFNHGYQGYWNRKLWFRERN